jgi:hypothetical protein
MAINNTLREMNMTTRRTVLLSLALPLAALVPAEAASKLKLLDPDKDGTVDLAEAKAAASKLFDKLDRDKAPRNSPRPTPTRTAPSTRTNT